PSLVSPVPCTVFSLALPSSPTRRSSDLDVVSAYVDGATAEGYVEDWDLDGLWSALKSLYPVGIDHKDLTGEAETGEVLEVDADRSEEHTSELQSRFDLVCRLLLEKKQ